MITTYSILFHFIMEYEGNQHSWLTGFYWTLTVMTTLGFGDITFHSDIGRFFSIAVLLSGVIFLLVLLPFTFIQFFYAPWIEAQSKSRAPRELAATTSNHIIITSFDPVTEALVKMLANYNKNYVIVIEELQKALDLYDAGYKVAVGAVDDPETYIRMRVNSASMVVATGGDEQNTNIAFTVRELSDIVPIATNVNNSESVDILELAGSSHVLPLKRMLGESLARRSIVSGAKSNIVGRIDELLIAEAPALGTPLVGKTVMECKLRENIGVNIIGIWERGAFQLPNPNMRISNNTVLMLAGAQEHFESYDEYFSIYNNSDAPALILGYGSVGRAVAETLTSQNFDYRIIEKKHINNINNDKIIIGNAADYDTLKKGGIDEAPSVIITTNDDAVNIYLTIYCRRLRRNMQIISRATQDKNISTLHRAGADLVMSYSSLGANAIFNLLQKGKVLMLTEGLDVFTVKAPPSLVGKSIIESQIRAVTQCNIVAVKTNGAMKINPEPRLVIQSDSEIVLIGTADSERNFIRHFGGSV